MKGLFSVATALCVLFLFSCSAPRLEGPVSPLAYESTVTEIRDSGVTVTGRHLSLDSKTGLFVLQLLVKNTSVRPLTVSWADAQLTAAGSFSFAPVNVEPRQDTLGGLKTAIWRFEFLPVNNPPLFQRYHLRGDLHQEYSLDLSFIRRGDTPVFSQHITYRLTDQQYQDYLVADGIESRLLEYSHGESSDTFAQRQSAYLERSGALHVEDPHAHEHTDACDHDEDENVEERPPLFVLRSGDEFYLDQLMIKLSPYRIGTDLFVHCRIINRLPAPVVFSSEEIRIVSGNRVLNTGYDFSAEKAVLSPINADFPASVLVLGQNDRAAFTLRFVSDTGFDTFMLDMGGFKTSKDQAIFYRALPFSSL